MRQSGQSLEGAVQPPLTIKRRKSGAFPQGQFQIKGIIDGQTVPPGQIDHDRLCRLRVQSDAEGRTPLHYAAVVKSAQAGLDVMEVRK